MRSSTTLAILFAALSFTTLFLGILGLFEGAPGIWPEGWPVLVVVHALLAVILGYYIVKTS